MEDTGLLNDHNVHVSEVKATALCKSAVRHLNKQTNKQKITRQENRVMSIHTNLSPVFLKPSKNEDTHGQTSVSINRVSLCYSRQCGPVVSSPKTTKKTMVLI